MELKTVSPTAKGPTQNFTGDVYITPVYSGQEPSRLTVALVRFAPGAHTNWHGAAADTFMSHLAMLEAPPSGEDTTTWLEPVPGDQYHEAHVK